MDENGSTGMDQHASLLPAFSQFGIISSAEASMRSRPPSSGISSLASTGSTSDLSDSSAGEEKRKNTVGQLEETVKKLHCELQYERNKNEGISALKSLSGEEQMEISRLKHTLTKVTSQKSQLENALKEVDHQSLSSIQSDWGSRALIPDVSTGAFNALVQENIRLKQSLEAYERKQNKRDSAIKRHVATSPIAYKDQGMDVTPTENDPAMRPGDCSLPNQPPLNLQHPVDVGKISPAELPIYNELKSMIYRIEQSMSAGSEPGSAMAASASCPSHLTDLTRETGKGSLPTDVSIVDLQSQNASLKQRLLKQDEHLREVVEMNTRWQGYNEQREQFVRELQKKTAEMNERSNQLGEEQQKQVDELIQQYKRKTAMMEEDKMKIEEENRQLRRELDESRKHITLLDKNVITLQSKLEEASRQSGRTGASNEDAETIDMLKAQIQICTEDFQSERRDRERAVMKNTELERELSIVKDQLKQFQGSYMQSFAERRAESLHKYQEEYRQSHPYSHQQPPPLGLVGRGGYQMDGVEDPDDSEDMIDVPLPMPRRKTPEQNSLLCPRCKKEFSANQHTALLDHIDVCCD